jgi:hypothetical protein
MSAGEQWACVAFDPYGDHEAYMWGHGTTRNDAIAEAIQGQIDRISDGEIPAGEITAHVWLNPVWEECPQGEKVVSSERDERITVEADAGGWYETTKPDGAT